MPSAIYTQACCCKNCEGCPTPEYCRLCDAASGFLWTVTGSPTGGPCGAGFDVAAEAHDWQYDGDGRKCELVASLTWISFSCKAKGQLISISSAPFSRPLVHDSLVIESASGLLVFYKPIAAQQGCCWYEGAYDVFWKEPACSAGTPAGSLVRA